MQFGRPHDKPVSLDDERALLHESRLALDRLKSELAERVAAVREREEELRLAVEDARRGQLPSTPPPAMPSRPAEAHDDTAAHELRRREQALEARQEALNQRERELARRERALAEGEAAALNGHSADEEREARIEARLAELKEAEKLFLRTRDEVAARSEAVAARERLVAQRERELDELEDAPQREARALTELEERLARLEQGRAVGEDTLGFSGGFRKLQQSGIRQRPTNR